RRLTPLEAGRGLGLRPPRLRGRLRIRELELAWEPVWRSVWETGSVRPRPLPLPPARPPVRPREIPAPRCLLEPEQERPRRSFPLLRVLRMGRRRRGQVSWWVRARTRGHTH